MCSEKLFCSVNAHACYDKHGDLWFNAKEIAHSLEFKNYKKILKSYVDDRDKSKLSDILENNSKNKKMQKIYINKCGVNSLAL